MSEKEIDAKVEEVKESTSHRGGGVVMIDMSKIEKLMAVRNLIAVVTQLRQMYQKVEDLKRRYDGVELESNEPIHQIKAAVDGMLVHANFICRLIEDESVPVHMAKDELYDILGNIWRANSDDIDEMDKYQCLRRIVKLWKLDVDTSYVIETHSESE